MNDEQEIIEIYEMYAVDGYETAEVADKIGVSLAEVHEAIAYYYQHSSDLKERRDLSDQSTDSDDIDTSHITKHPPAVDIDQYVTNCNFRIERMGADGLWVAAYTHDDDRPDHHYNISIREDGLHIRHRKED